MAIAGTTIASSQGMNVILSFSDTGFSSQDCRNSGFALHGDPHQFMTAPRLPAGSVHRPFQTHPFCADILI
ncbi:hypothetical protein [Xanthobacter versatilis]|uniref:hypothetical protein n=1 Tax=Xanthobacter autotrophicus (strain ATCC BAA-1158 / Py2) TaxID=78245 RepID=UPI0037299B35